MREMSSSAWLRRGSSIVFDQQSLGLLISNGALVPLRQAMGWISGWPDEPPGGGRTVLLGGLETCLAVMTGDGAERFLRERIKPFILSFQERWDQVGLVYGFGASPHSFEVTNTEEEVVFSKRGAERVRLSQFMWDGSSTLNITRLVREGAQLGRTVTVGYHVPRIS